MNKTLLIGAGGLAAGVAVAIALFIFFIGVGGAAETNDEPREPVAVPGRIGPHIVLEDRIFNIVSASAVPAYLKLQTLIEFETTSERWEYVLHGCVAPAEPPSPARLVSAVPGGAPAGAADDPAGGGSKDRCAAEEEALLAKFDLEMGTGRQLIEDAVTTIVSSYSVEELSQPAGKEALREEIRDTVDALMGGRHTVRRVLFLNFITQ